MEIKRTFIALDLPEVVRSEVAAVTDYLQLNAARLETGQPPNLKPVKGVSWVKPENLHITIKFLGDTDEPTEAKLVETLERITSTYAPFNLRLERPEILGKRVMSIAVRSDTATIFSLEMVIDTECERLGFKREGRRFHPHVTLARIRDSRSTSALMSKFLKLQLEPIEFEIREIVLYKSELTLAGPVYNIIKAFKLKD